MALLVLLSPSFAVESVPPKEFVPPLPTARQLPYLTNRFAAFIHFGITTFLPPNEDNNCVTAGNATIPLAPLSLFDPTTTVDTDQWLEAVVALGATQACLTVHHSGGFALWPSVYKNYTIANTPYGARHPGADLVRDFVASCRRAAVSPCFYIAPQVDCDLAGLDEAGYLAAMRGMLGELLGSYGAIDRLWLDTCWTPFDVTPRGDFGVAPWRALAAFLNATSPHTATFPGVDGCEVNSDYGYGRADYTAASPLPPVAIDAALPDAALLPRVGENCWTVFGGAGVPNVSSIYGGPPQPVFFKLGEDMQTMQRDGRWFLHAGEAPQPWPTAVLAAQYAATVLRGQSFILNVPPDASGAVPPAYMAAACQLGAAVKGLTGRVVAAAAAAPVPCPGILELPLPRGGAAGASAGCFNAVALAEPGAQVVSNYTLAVRVPGRVPATQPLPPARVPGPAYGQWAQVGGTTVGAGVLDLLPAGAAVCGADALFVALTGCLAGEATLAVEARLVDASALGPVPPP